MFKYLQNRRKLALRIMLFLFVELPTNAWLSTFVNDEIYFYCVVLQASIHIVLLIASDFHYALTSYNIFIENVNELMMLGYPEELARAIAISYSIAQKRNL